MAGIEVYDEALLVEADRLLQIADIAYFGRRRCGFWPDGQQSAAYRKAGNRVLLNCARQQGKSTVTALKAVHCAYWRPRTTIVVTAPVKQQTEEFLMKVRRLGEEAGLVKGGTKYCVKFRNGSRVVGVAANEVTIRGYSAVSLLVIDEAARVPDDVYDAMQPFLSTTEGGIWLLSTPNGQRGFFYKEWAEMKDTKWLRVKVAAVDCPRIPPEFLEEQRKKLGSRKFAQEYECLFVELDRGVFDPEVVRKAFRADVEPLTGMELEF